MLITLLLKIENRLIATRGKLHGSNAKNLFLKTDAFETTCEPLFINLEIQSILPQCLEKNFPSHNELNSGHDRTLAC